MRSEEEIRKAIRHFIALDERFIADFIEEDCCVKQLQILESAISELLTLRRRLEDREEIARFIYASEFNIHLNPFEECESDCREYFLSRADKLKAYLTEGSE